MTASVPQRRHIAHVIGSLRTGGAERQLVNYALAADRRRFRHTVVCLTGAGEMADAVREAGVDVVVVPVRLRTAPVSLARLAGWLRGNDVAVVHPHMYGAGAWGRLAGLMAGTPVLMKTEHGKELWKKRYEVMIDRWLARRTAMIITVSEDGRRIRMEREGVPADRIVTVPNGVPIPADPVNADGRARIRAEFGLAADQPVLGSVGRVVPAKGYPVMLEALAAARSVLPDLHWLQVGDGPDLPALRAAAAERGLADAVTFAGRRDDVPDLLAAMDVWTMSSIREGLPVALLEAMAAARTVVGTAVGGIPDAVSDGESGLLVPPGDAAALSAAIVRVLEDRELASRLAAGARRRAEGDFGIVGVARRLEEIYAECLADAGLPVLGPEEE